MVGILSKNYLWMRTLGSTPMNERENRERFSERVEGNVAQKLEGADAALGHMGMGAGFVPGFVRCSPRLRLLAFAALPAPFLSTTDAGT